MQTTEEGAIVDVSKGLCRIARLDDEPYAELPDLPFVLAELRESNSADVFTFRQHVPCADPQFPYPCEHDALAVLRVVTYDEWFASLGHSNRNRLKQAVKRGVVVRETAFDDDFLAGMHAIFNESPVRQGKPFTHYGKPIAQLRQEFSRYLFRETIYGAYLNDRLIGFIFLAANDMSLYLGQIISRLDCRDYSTNNVLIAHAVRVCVARQIPYLVYADWSEGSLGEFKRQQRFERMDLPRYYLPITLRGRLALRCGLHRPITANLSASMAARLKRLRTLVTTRWVSLRHRHDPG